MQERTTKDVDASEDGQELSRRMATTPVERERNLTFGHGGGHWGIKSKKRQREEGTKLSTGMQNRKKVKTLQ